MYWEMGHLDYQETDTNIEIEPQCQLCDTCVPKTTENALWTMMIKNLHHCIVAKQSATDWNPGLRSIKPRKGGYISREDSESWIPDILGF